MLPGAQQVRVAVKYTDQTSEFPEHLRQISLGEEIEHISQTIADGNVSLIPQVDGVVDSRDSLDRIPDSIDLTESPEKNTMIQKHIEKVNEDTSDNDTDDAVTYETDELKKSNRKNVEKVNEDTSDNDTDNTVTYETDELKKSNRKNVNTTKKKGRMAKYTL